MGFLSLAIALLSASGVWLLTSRDWLRIVIGLNVMGHGVNLFLLKSGGGEGGDPLPQALILTAIVIGLGTTAILLGLAMRSLKESRSRDVDFLQEESE